MPLSFVTCTYSSQIINARHYNLDVLNYKTIVLNRTFYVGVECVNPTLDASTKIKMV